MAINKITAPIQPPASDADWSNTQDLIEALSLGVEGPLRIVGSNVVRGAVFNIGGSVYIADADTAITGSASKYVKITPSGASATASYVASLTGVAWNSTYNGYYDGSGNLYLFDELLAYTMGVISTVYGNRNFNPSTMDRLGLGFSCSAGSAATALGYNSDATGTGSVAVGGDNIASGADSTAVGNGNSASNTGATSVGRDNTASGLNSLAVGYSNDAPAAASVAVGYNNAANTDAYTTAIGNANTASAQSASAIGYNNKASGLLSVSFGAGNTASGQATVAAGVGNTASGVSASAVGYSNTASGDNSFAAGSNQTCDTAWETAINDIRSVRFPAGTSHATIFNKLFSLVGTTTPITVDRDVSVIGHYGLNYISIISMYFTPSSEIRLTNLSTILLTVRPSETTTYTTTPIKLCFLTGYQA